MPAESAAWAKAKGPAAEKLVAALWSADTDRAVIDAVAVAVGAKGGAVRGMRAAIRAGEFPPAEASAEANRRLRGLFSAIYGPESPATEAEFGPGREGEVWIDRAVTGPPRLRLGRNVAWGARFPDGGGLTFPAIAEAWVANLGAPGLPAFPAGPVIRAWDGGRGRAARLRERKIRIEVRPRRRAPVRTARAPGLLHLSTLTAYDLEGAPFAARSADTVVRARTRKLPPPGELFPGPRTLAGEATGGMLMEAVAALIYGDGRSPLRADVLRLGLLAFALNGAARLTLKEGAILVGGRDTEANRKRFERAMRAARSLHVRVGARRWNVIDAELGPVYRLGPVRWWIDAMDDRLKIDGRQVRVPVAYQKSGALFLPATRWGVLERTVAGIEAALAWGPTVGPGSPDGRAPLNLRPDPAGPPGGPGPTIKIPWRQFLRNSGEHVNESTPYDGAAGKMYQRRVAMLRAHGFFAGPARGDGPIFAGRTVEVVRVIDGRGRGADAGVWVRATAEYCAIWASRRARTQIRADRLIRGPEGD